MKRITLLIGAIYETVGHLLLIPYPVLMAMHQRSNHGLTSIVNSDLYSSWLRVWINPVGKLPRQEDEGPENIDKMGSAAYSKSNCRGGAAVCPTDLVSSLRKRNQLVEGVFPNWMTVLPEAGGSV